MSPFRTAIELRDMRIHARHGIHVGEASTGHWFRVDVRVEPPSGLHGEGDRIENALDYEKLHGICLRVMSERVNLLETLASRILETIKVQWPDSGPAWVRVAKLHPPFGGSCAEIAIEMSAP